MELEAFGKMLRLKWHFRNENKDIHRNMFKPKSEFNPRNKDAAIELYLSSLEEKLMKVEVPKDKFNNLTTSERKALYDLKNDKSIAIKSADKGSAVVMWDREDYIKEAEKQLGDEEVYEEVSNDAAPLLKTINGVIAKIRKRGDLKRDTLDYFIMKYPKFARFYLLPKIHKRLHNVPGRPVISNSGYYTENISSFLDHHLQPLALAVKSYIKDTNEFLKKLRSLPKLPDDIILCTMDVVGLYPNIPHEEGQSALRKRLETRKEKYVSPDTIIELAEVVLKNNIFTFGKKTLKQKQGTAIGTKFAPPYSILFMAELEEEIIKESEYKPCLWWRYIDDIFFLWEHGENKLKSFIDKINKVHPTIKFTAEWSKTSINFLDVTVSLIEGVIETDLFVKPTDSHQYLQSSSCHPFHCKRGIPYSQALRLNRICSETNSFDKRCNDLERFLLERGYSSKLVRKEILRARKISRNELLDKEKSQGNVSKLTFNVTYYPVFRHLKSQLKELHVILACDEDHKKVFPEVPIIGFKNNKNLKSHLVRAALPDINEVGRCEPCGGKRPCQLCNNMKNTSTFKSKHSNEVYQIKKNFNSNSKMVVYLIECRVSGKQYNGSTVTEFCARANNYKSTHRNFRKEQILSNQARNQKRFHEHYLQNEHNGICDWEITIIDHAETVKSLRQKELYWYHKLKTYAPFGLNERDVYAAY